MLVANEVGLRGLSRDAPHYMHRSCSTLDVLWTLGLFSAAVRVCWTLRTISSR